MKLFANSFGARRSSASGRTSAEADVPMHRLSQGANGTFDSTGVLRQSQDSVGVERAIIQHQSGTTRLYRSGIHQIATMTFNNQDTVLMRAETDIHVCFLHDNRIYIFKKIPSTGDENNFIVKNPNSPFDDNIEEGLSETPHVETLVREQILHMLTSPKYRFVILYYV